MDALMYMRAPIYIYKERTFYNGPTECNREFWVSTFFYEHHMYSKNRLAFIIKPKKK